MMNSFERCMAAIRMEETDRIATDLHDFQICAEYSQETYARFVLDPERMAEMHIIMQQEFGHDLILVENGTASLAEAMGCTVIYRDENSPVAHKPALKALKDAKDIIISEEMLEKPLVKANLETVRILRERLGNRVMIMGRGDQGPFSLASQVYGMDRLLTDLLDEECEEDIHCLLEKCTEADILYCNALLDAGAHITSLGDSTAGPGVLSPAMYEEFALPYEKKAADRVHERGGLISLHICGNATRIIDKMVLTGADILEIDQETDIVTAYKAAKGQCALLGQISPVTLMNEDRERAASETKSMLEKVGGSNARGIILGPGCALGGNTPFENIKAMLNQAQAYS